VICAGFALRMGREGCLEMLHPALAKLGEAIIP
jgi:hypothetical protein